METIQQAVIKRITNSYHNASMLKWEIHPTWTDEQVKSMINLDFISMHHEIKDKTDLIARAYGRGGATIGLDDLTDGRYPNTEAINKMSVESCVNILNSYDVIDKYIQELKYGLSVEGHKRKIKTEEV